MEDGPKVSKLAIASLVLGLASSFLFLFGMIDNPLIFLGTPVFVLVGHISSSSLFGIATFVIGSIAAATGALAVKGSQQGSKFGWAWVEIIFAWTGIILGVIPWLLAIVFWLLIFVFGPPF